MVRSIWLNDGIIPLAVSTLVLNPNVLITAATMLRMEQCYRVYIFRCLFSLFSVSAIPGNGALLPPESLVSEVLAVVV